MTEIIYLNEKCVIRFFKVIQVEKIHVFAVFAS